MKKILLIGGLSFLVVVGLVVLVLWFTSTSTSPQSAPGATSFPSASSTTSAGGGAQATQSATLSLSARGGGAPIVVKDFLSNGITTPNTLNPGNYFVTSTSTLAYSIGYDEQAQFFTIALQQEPLGASRHAAEQFLLKTLGVSENELCRVQYFLVTDQYTNSFYAGKNLGFSFCPGATVLP